MVQKLWHKTKKHKKCQFAFLNKIEKNGNGNISLLCSNFWTNQNLDQFRPVKHVKMTVWTSVLWKMNIHIAKKWPEMVVTWSFIKGHSFQISLYAWARYFLHFFWKFTWVKSAPFKSAGNKDPVVESLNELQLDRLDMVCFSQV